MIGDRHESFESLMGRFRRRPDDEAFELIVAGFIRPALGVARQFLADADLAEDAVQEAFLRVIRNRRRYDPSKPFSAWFFTIVRNTCRDMLRRRARRQVMMQDLAEAARSYPVSPETPFAEEVLGLLPPGERRVLVLRIVEDLAFGDIASALGISEEAAKKRAQRGLRRLAGNPAAMDALLD